MKMPEKNNAENATGLEINNPLATLPLEVLFKILFYLDLQDWNELSKVDKYLSFIISQDALWKQLLASDFPEEYRQLQISTQKPFTNREVYISTYKNFFPKESKPNSSNELEKKVMKAIIFINRGDVKNLKVLLATIKTLKSDYKDPLLAFLSTRTKYVALFGTLQMNLFDLAINRGRTEIISLLLDHLDPKNPNVAALLIEGLIISIPMRRLDIVDLILTRNPEVINSSFNGETPFEVAASAPHQAHKMVVAFVQHGAILKSPLDACFYLKALLEVTKAQQDKNEHEKLIKTAFDDLINRRLFNFLTSDPSSIANLWYLVVVNNLLEVLSWLVNDKKLELAHYPSLLFTAVSDPGVNLKMFAFLLQHGDPNKNDYFGFFPIHYAIFYKKLAHIILLLSYGFKVELLQKKPYFNNFSELIFVDFTKSSELALANNFLNLHAIWKDHGNINGPEDLRSFETRRLEKIIAILNDWLNSSEKEFTAKIEPTSTGLAFFQAEQQSLKILIKEKISEWQTLQKANGYLGTEILLQDLKETLNKVKDLDLAARLLFLQGKLELQKYHIPEPTILPKVENDSKVASL